MRVLVAGDFYPCGNTSVLISEKQDYAGVLGNIRELVESVDYSIVNFESPVIGNDGSPIRKCGPNLRTTENSVQAIKWAGFKMVSLANNHILDYGEDGITGTINACIKYGIDTVGAGKNLKEASKVFYKQIGDQLLAVINCCEHEFSIATEHEAGANPLNLIQQYYQIKEAREKADYVLVIVHGGHEHFQLPSPRMLDTYRFFIDVGADVVVNHHQHYFSGYEVYKWKPIFYGLGNFCFEDKGQYNVPWNEGYIVTINFDTEISFTLYPYLQCNGNSSVKLLVDDTSFKVKMNKLNDIIANPEKLNCLCHEFYERHDKLSLSIFEPYIGKYFNAAFYRGWLPSFFKGKKPYVALNHIMCEAHRDKLIHLLNKKIKNK